jgi:hypothetical protein
MKVGMIQSNYLPWRGYFDFIDDVDVFVFYDDVQYTRRGWRNRNKIKTKDGPIWLTVPVLHDSTTLVEDARINYESRWVEKHIRSLTLAYKRAAYVELYADEIFDLLRHRPPTVSALNVSLCKWVMAKLDVSTRLMMSSEIGVQGDKFTRPLEILKVLGATNYLSGPVAEAYTDPEKFKEAGIGLEFKTYEYRPYPQLHGTFEPFVSVLDLLFNCGPEARRFLKSVVPNRKVV